VDILKKFDVHGEKVDEELIDKENEVDKRRNTIKNVKLNKDVIP